MNTIANVNASRTVRELAVEIPGATRLFEQLGIDYCCGGLKPLSEACADAQIPVQQVVEKLEAELQNAARQPVKENWQTVALSLLIDHINATHHVYLKQELPRLEKLAAKVVSVHGQNHPELQEIQNTFLALSSELSAHLMKEEQILFPYIVQTERGESPQACFGDIESPIRMMEYEHESAGEALRQLRQLGHDYTPPEDACTSYQTLYQSLKAMEADLHQHIHLENNILFPRALAME
jgi:regulator of cell morphogenesis and NO signaling